MINMQQLSQMLLALFIGFCGSVLFIFLHLPLPWLLGAIFTTSIAMRFEKLPIQNPKIFSAPARIFIGLIIGSAFTPEILEFLHIYLFSILLIIPYSIIVTFAGMYYYVKVLKFDRKTAFFSSTPGGVVEMVILGEEQKAKLKNLSVKDITSKTLANEEIENIFTNASGNNASIGGLKVTTANGWFAARPSGTEDIYKIYAESFISEEHLELLIKEAQDLVTKSIEA